MNANAQEWLQFIEKLYQVLKDIKNIDLGTALGGGFIGVLYLILHWTIPHLFGLDYLWIIIFLGSLLGSGISRLFFNEERAKLREFRTQRKITQEKIQFLQASVELGLYLPTEAEKTAKQIIDQFLLEKSILNPTNPTQLEASEEK